MQKQLEKAKRVAALDEPVLDDAGASDEDVQDDEFPSHDAAGQTSRQVLRNARSHPSRPRAHTVAHLGSFLGVEGVDVGSDLESDIDSYDSEPEVASEAEVHLSDLGKSDETDESADLYESDKEVSD